ncbi:hypothetical protein FXO37_36807, partial [Capsicum annuum]
MKIFSEKTCLYCIRYIRVEKAIGAAYERQDCATRGNLHVRIFGSSKNVDRAEQRFIDSLMVLYESKQLEVHLCGGLLPPNLMKKIVTTFGPDLSVLKEKSHFSTQTTGNEAHYAVCLCELEDPYRLEVCTHAFYRSCLVEQCESSIKSRKGFPMCYLHSGCGEPFLLANLKSLLSIEKLEEIFRASLGAFVIVNVGTYRFCPSPYCHSVYQITASDMDFGALFVCDACYGSMSDK